MFCDKKIAKITLGIKSVWEIISENVKYQCNFFDLNTQRIIEAIFNHLNLLSQKSWSLRYILK